VLDVSLSSRANEHALGDLRADVDEAKGPELLLVGWALGRSSRATGVEVIVGNDVIAHTPVRRRTPKLAERFKNDPNAATAGFRLRLVPQGGGDSELIVRAVLEDDMRVPLGTIRVRVGRRGLFRRFRR
jgi:hypothetical protein